MTTPSTIDVLTMLGSWFSGLGATAAVVYSVNINRSGLKCYAKRLSNQKIIKVEWINHKPVKAYITDIRLELVDGSILSEHSSVRLTDYKEKLNVCIEPGQRDIITFAFDNLAQPYTVIFPWYKVSEFVTMPRVRISIYIMNGRRIDIALPDDFYSYYCDEKLRRSEEETKFYHCYSLKDMKNKIDSYVKIYGIFLKISKPTKSLKGMLSRFKSLKIESEHWR